MNIHTFKSDMIILGLTIKEPVENALISVDVVELKYNNEHFKNCISLTYQKTIAASDKTFNQDQINNHVTQEVNLLLQSLALLLARPFQLISVTSWIDDQEVELRLPPRKLPPGIYNIAGLTRQHRPKDNIKGYAVEIKDAFWKILELFIIEFQKKPADSRDQLSLAMRWIVKANKELLIGRLIAYWVAFNTLYKSLHNNDQDAIKLFMRNNIDNTIAMRIVKGSDKKLKSISKFHVELGRGRNKKVVSDELADLLSNPKSNNIAIIENMVLVIYGVRNSLFHGGYSPDTEETDIIVGLAEQLLGELLKEIIGKTVLGNPLPTTAYIGPEKAGLR